MRWVVESAAAYDAWDETTDPEADSETRIAVLECIEGWWEAGPPPEAEFDEHRQTYSFDVPGTSVVVEFVMRSDLRPPGVTIRSFLGS